MSKTTKLELQSHFAPASSDHWLELAVKTLKGKKPRDTKLTDGVTKAPIYFPTAEESQPVGWPEQQPWIRGSGGLDRRQAGWDVRIPCVLSHTPLEQITVGISEAGRSVWLTRGWFTPSATAKQPALTRRAVFDHLDLSRVPVAIDAHEEPEAAWDDLRAAGEAQGLAPDMLTGVIRADPAEFNAAYGSMKPDLVYDQLAKLALDGSTPWVHVVNGSALAVHRAGASAPLGVATAVASAVETWRALHSRGVPLDTAIARTELSLGAHPDQFLTIATVRAARWVYGMACAALGGSSKAPFVHVTTGLTSSTRYSAELNMLRGTNEAAAAAMAGADAITLTPYDAASGTFEDLPARIARNAQLLLAKEAHLARVVDPAGGSGLVESLTEQVARRAWDHLQWFDAQGGVLKAVNSGALEEVIAATRAERDQQTASRRQVIVGVNDFAHHQGDVQSATTSAGGSLSQWSAAGQWEALVDTMLQIKGHVASVNIGPTRRHSARAGFARRYLEAIGLTVTDLEAPASATKLGPKLKAGDGCLGVVICGHQEDYDERVEQLAKSATKAGARFVLLAGKPPEGLATPSVTGSCHLGMNGLKLGQELMKRLTEVR